MCPACIVFFIYLYVQAYGKAIGNGNCDARLWKSFVNTNPFCLHIIYSF